MITIGADPEVFLYDARKSNGVVSAEDVIPGTKEEPYAFGDGTFVHLDNVCIEMGWEPTSDPHVFADYCDRAIQNIEQEFLDRDNQSLWFNPAATFTREDLDTEQARQFGCDPDYDAYSGGRARGTIPTDLREDSTRYCGGHVHLGGDFNCPAFAAALFADIGLGLKGIADSVWFLGASNQHKRKSWYGRPGIYRPKPYGIEYRTLTNEWAASGHRALAMAHNAMRLGNFLENTQATRLRSIMKEINWMDVQELLTVGRRDDLPDYPQRVEEVLDDCRKKGVDV